MKEHGPPREGKNYINEANTYETLLMGSKSGHVKRQELQEILRQVGKIYCHLLEQQILQNAG